MHVLGGGVLERGLDGEHGTSESGWTFSVTKSGGSEKGSTIFMVKYKVLHVIKPLQNEICFFLML